MAGIFFAVLAGVFLLVENFWPHGWTWHRDPGVGLIVAMIIFGCLAVLLINAVKAIIRSRRQHLAYEAMLRPSAMRWDFSSSLSNLADAIG